MAVLPGTLAASPAQIKDLLQFPDGFELVRDQIAAILATEIAEQQALATAAGEDPDDYKAITFLERHDPFDQYVDPGTSRTFPIVNVWFDSLTMEKGRLDGTAATGRRDL